VKALPKWTMSSGQHVGVLRRAGAGGDQDVEQLRREAGVQGAAAVGVDADPVALQALVPGAGGVAFVDGDADPGPAQAVGQAQPAGSRADDDDVEHRFCCGH